jgi:4-fold beta-flower domain-containing protein
MDTLYDSRGHATAYVDDDGTSIYLYDGSAVGWIDQVDVYAYSGRYLGWMQDGWFFDRSGNRAFFTDATRGGPVKPARAARPARADRAARRARGARQEKPERAACALSWAPLSGVGYFNQ